MNHYLLDAAGAAILIILPLAILLLLFVWGLIEGFFIYLFKINRFWKSVWHAIIINIISLIVGFIIIGVSRNMGYEEYTDVANKPELIASWVMFWALSILVEALVLKALNKTKGWGKIFFASLLMNIFTYIVLYAYVYYTVSSYY
jgi:hypothetical protein